MDLELLRMWPFENQNEQKLPFSPCVSDLSTLDCSSQGREQKTVWPLFLCNPGFF